MFLSIIQHQRSIDFNSDEIPNLGGNWTHYFVCSDGEKIDYDFPKPDFSLVIQRGKFLLANSTIPVGSLSVTRKSFAP